MARKNSSYRSSARPMLTTEEVMQITGAPRRTLTGMTELGEVEPARFDERRGVLGWTFGQAQAIEHAESLRRHGASLEDTANDGYAQLVAASSDARRTSKRALLHERSLSDAEAVGEREGFYVRYLPQRWLAAVPFEGSVPGSDAYVRARMALRSVADCAGWCALNTGGTLHGCQANGKGIAFCNLADQPLPFPAPGLGTDGGCYRFSGGPCAFEDEETDCDLCPRFLRKASPADVSSWALDFCADACCPAPAIAEVDPDANPGPWADFVRLWNAGGTLDATLLNNEKFSHSRTPIAGRPQAMPVATPLPGQVFAVALPAGYYLCLQAAEGAQESASTAMHAATRFMRKKPLTAQVEAERAGKLEALLKGNGLWWRLLRGTECAGPLTGPILAADPELEGWWAPLEEEDIARVGVFTMAGLSAGEDHVIVCATTPSAKPSPQTRYELQVLIDEDTLPAAVKKKKKKGLRRTLLGAMPKGYGDEPERRTVRCRCCGASFGVEEQASVAECPQCGEPRVLPATEHEGALAMLEQADAELAGGQWDAAAASCELARRWAPNEPEADWIELLAHHQVRWIAGKPQVGDAGAGSSLSESELFARLIEAAAPSTRRIYQHQAAAIDAAR